MNTLREAVQSYLAMRRALGWAEPLGKISPALLGIISPVR
jgi:hypothetical protein